MNNNGSLSKLLSKNVIIYGGTNALKSLVPLLMLPILTSYLSISDFGVLSLLETTILFLTPFILLNINAAINVEYFKIEHQKLKKYITNALMLSFLASLLVLCVFSLFQTQIASLLKIDDGLVLFIVFFSVLRVLSSVVLGLYQSRQESFKYAIFILSQTLFDFLLSYIFVVIYHYGYIGRLSGTYLSLFVFSFIALYLLYKMDYLSKITFKYTKDILNFGVPLIPHAVSGTVMAMSDRYFISYFIGNDKVGLYTIAYQLSALMLLVSLSVNQAWSPMLFRLLKEKNMKQIYKFTFILFILFAIVGISLYFMRDLLFFIFVKEHFYMAKEYYGWLLVGFTFQSFYFLVTNFLFYEKRTKLLASMTFMGAIINIVLNYIFIQQYGVIGVAYATAITWGLFFVSVLLIDIQILRKEYK
jgi:O-antigen/teichoic acid export membrane protein